MTEAIERQCMERAVALARASRGEFGKVSPLVGAVVLDKDGQILGGASRGEDDEHKQHAEYNLLKVKLPKAILAGSTVFTTLEPCFQRNPPKKSCASRLAQRRVARVVIGMLDPDPTVHGKGQMQLLRSGINVGTFDHDLTSQILEMNSDFIEDRESPGLIITSPMDGAKMPRGEIKVTGKYRPRSSSGDRLALFTRRVKTHWPQERFVVNEDGTWECTITENHPGETTIIAAQVDPNCELWIEHYLKVTKVLDDPKRYVGLEIEKLPGGIRVGQRITIKID
jgi:pyrimidine deaminase RibD-like protein